MAEAAIDRARGHLASARRLVERQEAVVAELERAANVQRTLDAAHGLLRELTVYWRAAERHLQLEEAFSGRASVMVREPPPGGVFWPPDAVPQDSPLPTISESSRVAIARSRAVLALALKTS
jgi:hypothetical protein